MISGSGYKLLFVPYNSSSFVHFAFVTFSALLFAFIYGFCLTLKEKF